MRGVLSGYMVSQKTSFTENQKAKMVKSTILYSLPGQFLRFFVYTTNLQLLQLCGLFQLNEQTDVIDLHKQHPHSGL